MSNQVTLEYTGEYDANLYPDLPDAVKEYIVQVCEVMCKSFKRKGGKVHKSKSKFVHENTEYIIILHCDGIHHHD